MDAKKNMLLNTWAVFFYFFAQWLVTILVTRLIGYEAAGQYSLAVSFANMFSFIGAFGVRGFQIGDVNYDFADGQYFALRIVTGAAALLLFAIVLPLRGYGPGVVQCCIAMMVYKLLECMDDAVTGTLQRSGRFAWIAVSYTGKALLPLTFFLAGVLARLPLPAIVLLMAAAYLLVQLVYDLPRLVRLCGRQGRPQFRGILAIARQCLPLMLTAVLDAVLVFLPRDAVERAFGSEILGYYSTVSIIVVVLSTLGGGVWGALAPMLSRLIKGREWAALRRTVRIVFLCIGTVGVLTVVLGDLLGPVFFSLVFGPEILDYMYLLTPVLLNAVLLLVNSFFLYLFIPLRRRTAILLTDAAAVLACLVLEPVMVARCGLLGACLGLTGALALRLLLLGVSYRYYLGKAMRAQG